MTIRDEGGLSLIDKGRKNCLHTVGHPFGYALVEGVAARDRPEVPDVLRFFHFGNKDKVGVVNLTNHLMIRFKGTDHVSNGQPNNIPVFLVEDSLDTIRSWGFESPHIKYRTPNFLIGESASKVQ